MGGYFTPTLMGQVSPAPVFCVANPGVISCIYKVKDSVIFGQEPVAFQAGVPDWDEESVT